MVTTVESAIPRTTCQMWPSTRSCNPEAPEPRPLGDQDVASSSVVVDVLADLGDHLAGPFIIARRYR